MRPLFFAWVLLVLSACAHHAPKVDCEGHLVPINPPNPVEKSHEAPHTP